MAPPAWVDTIINANATLGLRTLPDSSVNCVITSPPYYKQRDYSTKVQIGNEDSPEEYVTRLREVFEE